MSKQAESLRDLIKRKQKAMSEKKTGMVKTIKPQPGTTQYLLLPGWNPDDRNMFFHDFGLHWIKTEKGGKPVAVHLCEDKSFDDVPCDICAAIGQAVSGATTQEQLDVLKECNAQQKYLFNVLDLGGEDKKTPKVLEVGATVFSQICDALAEEGDFEVLSEQKGIVFSVKREGTGFDTKYNVLTKCKTADVPDDIMANLVNLEEFVVGHRDATKHKTAIGSIGSVIGLLPADSAVTTKKIASSNSVASELDEVDLEDDVPFESGEKDDEVGLDDDDLEELMRAS